jgi:hypothetical protein
VLKAGAWYLVARRSAGMRVYRVSRFVAVRARDDGFERPEGFDLATFWQEWSRTFEASRPRVSVTLRASELALRQLPPDLQRGDGVYTVGFESLEDAFRELLKFGPDAEVLEPAGLRERLASTAQEVASCTASARSARVSHRWSAGAGGRRGNGASGLSESWALFLWSRIGRSGMAAEETKHYLANGAATAPDAREALEWARETTAKMVDLKFCDLLGTWQHMTLPITAFDESAFDDGLGFDGSSIRGWQGISESDMLLMPDASSAILDPFTEAPTLSLICEIADPLTREGYARTRAASPGAPRSTSARRRSPTRRSWGPSASSSSSTRSRTSSARTRALPRRLRRGPLELRQAGARLHGAREGGLLPAAPHDTLTTCARRWC